MCIALLRNFILYLLGSNGKRIPNIFFLLKLIAMVSFWMQRNWMRESKSSYSTCFTCRNCSFELECYTSEGRYREAYHPVVRSLACPSSFKALLSNPVKVEWDNWIQRKKLSYLKIASVVTLTRLVEDSARSLRRLDCHGGHTL